MICVPTYFQVLGISSYLPQKEVSASPDKEVEEKEGAESEKRVESDSATTRGEEKASPPEEMETSKEEDSDSESKDELTKLEEKILEDIKPEERVMLKASPLMVLAWIIEHAASQYVA